MKSFKDDVRLEAREAYDDEGIEEIAEAVLVNIDSRCKTARESFDIYTCGVQSKFYQQRQEFKTRFNHGYCMLLTELSNRQVQGN